MKYIIEINCDNAAFQEDPAGAVSGVLDGVSMRVSRYGLEDDVIHLLDSNGNTVGTAEFVSDNETYREIPTLDQEDV